MAMAVVLGAGSGALHAVTGPDHVLSLGPVALRVPRAAWRVGLLWGVGHGLGTLLLALPVWWLAAHAAVDAGFVATAERVAGLMLVGSGAVALARASSSSSSSSSTSSLSTAAAALPVGVGFVHGATGAGALLLVVPVLVASSLPHVAAYLLAFGLGGALAMAALTAALARLGSRLGARTLARAQRVAGGAAVLLGAVWLCG